MSELEPRYACPVCLGATMAKLQFVSQADLQLDYCRRCGGIWFDAGEVEQLQHCRPQALWRQIALRENAYRMTCHACLHIMPRNAGRCPACNWSNILNCPICAGPMRPVMHQKLKLDACPGCKGVWFDHIELAELWNLELKSHPLSSRAGNPAAASVSGDTAGMFVDVLIFSPEIASTGIQAAAQGSQAIVSVTAEVISNVPNAAGAVSEGASNIASGVFETIAEIIGGIFS